MKCLKLLLLAAFCLPLVGCITSQKSAETESASTEWRIKSLEESFLNFREQQRKMADEDARSREKLEKRMAEVEAELAALRGGQAPSDAPRGETWSSDLQPEEDGWVEGGKNAEKDAPKVENDAEKPWAKVPEPPAVPEPPQTIPEPEVITRAQAPKPAPAVAKPTPKPAKPAPRASGAKALYERGYGQYNAGQFQAARATFDEFTAKYPHDDLAANALYWKGETYYSERNYAQAILAFKEVTGRFPKHDKAAAALLKIGMSYDRVGDPDNAIFYLRALVEDFPESSAAGLGRKELARLGG
ncbi:Outer membrane protein assembly factor BamD [Pseudodesulfovibrio hydrargyri]|uniref:Outer membrane protein assembly factor BamD n=1 Tax=Pseudodesulfovibrio hydrargyri TaxID=2125990 RepID=A0A1J5N799_9BACT|nr:tol-pal system protein YbgF [Pseudodesulfovibrio hydrargyri]OIQ51507.1 Outer membrane protein assembly factor BamD [Pseudodesulfovibrio hydrargyri]